MNANKLSILLFCGTLVLFSRPVWASDSMGKRPVFGGQKSAASAAKDIPVPDVSSNSDFFISAGPQNVYAEEVKGALFPAGGTVQVCPADSASCTSGGGNVPFGGSVPGGGKAPPKSAMSFDLSFADITSVISKTDSSATVQSSGAAVAPRPERPSQLIAVEAAETKTIAAEAVVQKAAAPPPSNQKSKQHAAEEDPYKHLWRETKTSHFNVFTEKAGGMGTTGMEMSLEGVYQKFMLALPWMLPSKTNVYIYKSKTSYLNGQFSPPAWSNAVFFPTKYTVAIYDAQGKKDETLRDFMHEFTHMINEIYFNPGGEKNNSMPLFLDEGMALIMEEQNDPSAGYWYRTFQSSTILSYGDYLNVVKNKTRVPAGTVFFYGFNDFIKDGSLSAAEKNDNVLNWYLQAYSVMRFLWQQTPGKASASRQMQFERFLSALAGVDRARNIRVAKKPLEQALKEVYGFKNISEFEAAFWQWRRTAAGSSSASSSSGAAKQVYQSYSIFK